MPRFSAAPLTVGRDDPSLLDVPMWDAVKATASETFGSSPTEATSRADQVQLGRKDRDRLDLRLPWLREDDSASRFVPGKQASPLLTKEQAASKIEAAGLTGHLKVPEQGENEAALDLLIGYKTDELRNNFILDRYRGGVAGGAINLGTALATSLVDPINIGSAFVPVVGEARYAAILGSAGKSIGARAATRAGVGAIEGAVGAAMVEPLVYRGKKEIQADYDAMDSLMNIGFGGLFGGVLQPAAGAIGDVFARRAGIGAWAEPTTGTLDSAAPAIPDGWLGGGGTQFVDGEDYVNGSWAVVDANSLPPMLVEPTLQAGMVRLYHGSAQHGRVEGDAWFSTNRQYAANYRNNAELQFIDVPEAWANSEVDPDGYGQTIANGFNLNREIKEGDPNYSKRTVIGKGKRLGRVDAGQVGASPWADSGAPVVDQVGTVRNGNSRMATILGDYADGQGVEYRNQIIENAEKYGLDGEQVSALQNPVLVRLEGERKIGVWGEYQRMLADTPAVRAARQPFESPDVLASRQFIERARTRGVSEKVAQELVPAAARDDVTGFYDARQAGMKSRTMQRAIEHAKSTGEPAAFVSADIANLGGLNASVANRADEANIHFREMAAIMDRELRNTGADVVPMRTGGDELGAIVVNARLADIDAALTRAEVGIAEYSKANGLDTIPHPKGGAEGVGMHFGMAEIRGDSEAGQVFAQADNGVDISKRGGGNDRSEILASAQNREPRVGTGITEQKNQAAVSVGVSQAVNGAQINPAAAMELDGTQAGVERFLEIQRLADAGLVAERDTQVANLASIRQSLEEFSPEQTAKLEQDVEALEARIREDVRAAGGDEADIDAALADVADITAEAEIESKALKGISLCMLRNV